MEEGFLYSLDDEQRETQQGEAVRHPDSGDRSEYVPCHRMSEIFRILQAIPMRAEQVTWSRRMTPIECDRSLLGPLGIKSALEMRLGHLVDA